MSQTNEKEQAQKLPLMGLLDHFEDLRWCIFRSLIAFIIALPLGLYFSDDFIVFSKSLSKVSYFTALGPAEPFIQKILVGIYLAIFVTFPYVLFQLWRFVSLGLYTQEKHLTSYMLIISYLLFSCGAFFGLTIVVPTALDYFLLFSGESIIYQPHLKEVISFILKVSMGMGVAAQLPVIIIILYSFNVVSINTLTRNRGIILVIILILSAFLTPPDVISLLLLALPLYICYELSTLFCRIMDKSVGDILHKKRSRMMSAVIFFLIIFLIIGVVIQVNKDVIRYQLNTWINFATLYLNKDSNTAYFLETSQQRLELLMNWKKLSKKNQSAITTKMKELWQDNKLSNQEKYLFFKSISNFGLRKEGGKVNIKIDLPTHIINRNFKLSYYLKVILKNNITKGEELYHLFFGNQLQYISYSKGENLLPKIQINDIYSLFPQLLRWNKENKLVIISLILSPTEQTGWFRVMESEPFIFGNSLGVEK